MKIPTHLIPFDDRNLVKTSNFPVNDDFIVWDKNSFILARAGTAEMAQLICDSINLAYQISKVYGEKI